LEVRVDSQGVEIDETQPVGADLARSWVPGRRPRLVSIAGPETILEFHEELREIIVGRHAKCDIVVQDRRASAKHFRIFACDGRYFLEQLSPNGCFINEQCLRKDDRRVLIHGDEISVCMHARETRERPFAAYVFQHPRERDMDSRVAAMARPSRCGASASRVESTWVDEQWVADTWDLRVVLGSGAFSTVYLGLHVRTGARRAVKRIEKDSFLAFQRKRNSQLELRAEVETLMGLQHPGIVRFHSWFETEAHLYLVMDLLEGGDLLCYISRHGFFEEGDARRLFRELAGAVAHVHDKGVVHRDLKPENIMLTERSAQASLKLVDFGLARPSRRSADCRTFCGTPQYFAPEVIATCKGGDHSPLGYGTQVDAWSLGVILYIMLSGIEPFDDQEDGGLFALITAGRFGFASPPWEQVSEEAKDLVRRLLRVNPKERLTVQQSLGHPWLRLPEGPEETSVSVEPDAKRRRTATPA